MARHKQKHPGSGSHAHPPEPDSKKFHKDWRVWVVVGLMLAAMIMYVVTLDDSVVPVIMRQ